MALGWNSPRALDVLRLKCPNGALSLGRRRCTRRRSGSSAPSSISTVLSPKARKTIARGSIMAAGRNGAARPRSAARQAKAAPTSFSPPRATGLHQIPVGPVHAGVIEPGHFRFHASGETVVRLEERLGYLHKGVDALLRGADMQRAASLAGRISGDSTVAYSIAFARAVERRWGFPPASRTAICAESWPRSSASPTTLATSARSATTPRFR